MQCLFMLVMSIMLFFPTDAVMQKDSKDEGQFVEVNKCNRCGSKKIRRFKY
ncbi:exported hypothetical protein [Candidatus Xenohaliotis californiensis]|uniref:Uncharacterized protein n=1 Tax=Candidatus Xenohaliotis californiensis TaxID=84677 RepID=A0ABM9N8K5_9RICK|nr:exported hypothetical protein [Candidatus Xenohaliotis californiensis]